ncbi:hypothetical protein CHLRE_06g255250v5 [Chlamydomonas reinhardtii]|uniref:Uncharacterized protein n=1 Tax=Chlamydomonas reinhardtii TaxID=3055 RepID=A0A2K3DM97_CHLRE|nr:uncharacterized protein CHLRE_06g255250v5 [Chlamydomonas reinhardtii]PNW81664.1 hypothetical protein CHLRE_06g255250v5 [Chlamydomonas reinhardtii]
MGKSDKDKKRKRSDSDSSDSYTSSSSESDRDEEKRRDKKRKKHKKDKDRKEKSKDKDKKSSKSKSKDDLVKQARAFLEQQLGGAGTAGSGRGGEPPASSATAGAGPLPPVQVSEVKEPITPEDYFRRHAEFAAFLAEERRTQFNELSSERSHELFEEFVRIWNEGRLPARYYAGMVAAPARRTEYRWNLKGAAAVGGRPGGGAMGMTAFMDDQRSQKQEARLDGRRQDRARAKELLEDVAPRETGRDKMVAERAARRELARSGRDDDGPGGYLPGGGRGDDALMGGDDSFAAAKAREAKRQEFARQRGVAKMEDVAQRAAAFQAKEDEKLAGLRALLSKGPITIAKRT